jgi:hypothetical protein
MGAHAGDLQPAARPGGGGLISEIGFAATATLYEATGLVLMMAIVPLARGSVAVHAPANAK